jgi:copper chaperone
LTVETTTLKIEGMSCEHCVQSVTKALQGVEGVSRAEVDLASGSAVVDLDAAKADIAQLRGAVDEAGYKVVEV